VVGIGVPPGRVAPGPTEAFGQAGVKFGIGLWPGEELVGEGVVGGGTNTGRWDFIGEP
jgi:hypothetical protein